MRAICFLVFLFQSFAYSNVQEIFPIGFPSQILEHFHNQPEIQNELQRQFARPSYHESTLILDMQNLNARFQSSHLTPKAKAWLMLMREAAQTLAIANQTGSNINQVKKSLKIFTQTFTLRKTEENNDILNRQFYKLQQLIKPNQLPLHSFFSLYLNRPNFSVRLSEKYIKRKIETSTTTSGNDNSGGNRTNFAASINISVDVKPSQKGGIIDITPSGHINSNTSTQRDQAHLNFQGNHSFQALKRIILQNDKIYPQATVIPQGGISVSQMLAGYQVNLQDRRLLNRLYHGHEPRGPVRRVLGRRARQRLGNRVRTKVDNKVQQGVSANNAHIHQLTESKIRSKVISSVDSQVLAKLNALGGKLQKSKDAINKKTRRAGIEQRFKNYHSTDTELITDILVGNDYQLGAGQPNQCQSNISDLSVFMHQSVFNNYYRTQKLGGKSISTSNLRKQIKKVFNTLSNKPSTDEPIEDDDSSGNWKLAKKDPITLRLNGNEIQFELNAALISEDEEKPLYFNIIAPISLKFTQQSLSLRLGHISAHAKEQTDLSRHQLVTKIQEIRQAANSLLASVDLNYEIWNVQSPHQKKQVFIHPQSKIQGEWICIYYNL